MLKAIENIIVKGGFAGCNLVLRKGTSDNLNVILSFLLPSSVNDDVTSKHNNQSVNTALDNVVNLRALLTSPIVAIGNIDSLPEKLEQAIFERTEAMIDGATALSSLDISALIKQSKDILTTVPSNTKEATAVSESEPASTTEISADDDDETESEMLKYLPQTTDKNEPVSKDTEKTEVVNASGDFTKDFDSL